MSFDEFLESNMDIEAFEEVVKEKTEELSFGIGMDKDKLSEMGYSNDDIALLRDVKEKGDIVVDGDTITTNGLAAKIASDYFLQIGYEVDNIVEEEIDHKRIKSSSQMGSFHFMKLNKESDWMCFKAYTSYDYGGIAPYVTEFTLKEYVPELGRTKDLSELVNFVHSEDKDFTENLGKTILNKFRFDLQEFEGVSYR